MQLTQRARKRNSGYASGPAVNRYVEYVLIVAINVIFLTFD